MLKENGQVCTEEYTNILSFNFSGPRTPESILTHILVFSLCPIKYDDCSTRICMGLNKFLRILKSILTRT